MGKFCDLSGCRFGRLTILSQAERGNHGQIRWLCQCDCGRKKVVEGQALKSGATKSCGCYHKEVASKTGKKNCTKHGCSKERLYGIWLAMRRRCNNPNADAYPWYGGKGIKVCEEWQRSYSAFRTWALKSGYDEKAARGKCTIDRIDSRKDYSPENCRWVTQKEQARNKSSNHIVEFRGEEIPISELAERENIPYGRLQSRIKTLKWDVEKAVHAPLHFRK